MNVTEDSQRCNVLIPGIFDLFHKGHRKLLKEAFKKFEKIIVGIYTDSWLKTHDIYYFLDEKERYHRVSNWISSHDKSHDKSFIDVHFLNDNEKHLLNQYNLSHFVCGEGHQWFTGSDQGYNLLFDNPEYIINIPRLHGISSHEILEKSHPLLQSQEIWIYHSGKKTKEKKLFLHKTKKTLHFLDISQKKVDALFLKKIITKIEDGSDPIKKKTALLISSEMAAIKNINIISEQYPNIFNILYVESSVPSHVESTSDSKNPIFIESHTDSIFADILRYYDPNEMIIKPPKLHENITSFGDFKIHMNQDVIEKGGYGSIYAVTHDFFRQNKYVAKIVDVTNLQQFQLECVMCVRAGKMSYGPIVHAYFHCPQKEKGVIIMDRWKGDMDKKEFHHNELEDLLDVVQKMHNDGIFHNDLYTRNILYRTHPTKTDRLEFCVADYGLAFHLKTEVPSVLRAADLASLVYGLYDTTRIDILDGIHPEKMQKMILPILLSRKTIIMKDWITGIRWRVLNTIREDGNAVLPNDDLNFADVEEMYEYIFRYINKKMPFSGATSIILPVHIFLEKCACSEWISSKKAHMLDERAIKWYISAK